MYNYNNTQKSNVSKQKKMSGPNADRVNPYMAPGAYQQPNSKKSPDWAAAAGGYGDRLQAFYRSRDDQPWHDHQKYLAQQAAIARANAINPPAVANPANISRQTAPGATPQTPPNVPYQISGAPLQPQGAGLGVPSQHPRTGLEGYYGFIPPAGWARDKAMEDEYDYRRRVRDANMAKGMPELGAHPPLAKTQFDLPTVESSTVDTPEYQMTPAELEEQQRLASKLQNMPYRGRQQSPDDIVGELEMLRTDGRPVYQTRDGRTIIGEPGTTSRDPRQLLEAGSPNLDSPSPQSGANIPKHEIGWPQNPQMTRDLDRHRNSLESAYGLASDAWNGMKSAVAGATPGTPEQSMPSPFGLTVWDKAVQGAVAGERQRIDDRLSSMTPEQRRRLAGGSPSMSDSEIRRMDAETNARIERADAMHDRSMARRDEIMKGYAPYTDSLRGQADTLAKRSDRAEAFMRGDLGPRSTQADPSGPYYRDSTGRPYDNHVGSTYSISEAGKARDQKLWGDSDAAGDAYKVQREEQRDELRNRTEKPIEDPVQMARDAQKFSSDYNLYRKGGGRLGVKDYIIQRAAQGPLPKDLTKQLEHNYGLNLSSEVVQGVEQKDITSQRDVAMDQAAASRSARADRRQAAKESIADDTARRNAMDRQIAADRNAGYYNTLPLRESQRMYEENTQRAMEFQQKQQAAELAGQKDLVKAKADAEAAAYKRQYDEKAQDEWNAWVNSTRAEIKAQGYSGDPNDPSSPAGIEFGRRQRGYQGRRPGPVTGENPPTPDTTTPPVQPPKSSFGELEADLTSGDVKINPNASQLDQTNAMVTEAGKRNLPVAGMAEFIKNQPGGLDLTDPVVATDTLDKIIAEMNDHGRRTAAQDGGRIGDKFSQGRTQILNKYSGVLGVLRSTLGDDAVNKAIDRVSVWDGALYKNVEGPGTEPLGVLGPLTRGAFGG